jgi:hypothetical protein
MAAFTQDDLQQNWLIWDLFQNGGVVLFKKPEPLQDAIAQLRTAGYRVHEVDCSQYQDEGAFLGMIVDGLGIPKYPGGTGRDGFNDFVWQLEFENCTGVVLCLNRFEVVCQRARDLAIDILDILADNQRHHMLFGNRLLTLVQSQDAELDQRIGRIGGFLPIWNRREWLLRDRGLG